MRQSGSVIFILFTCVALFGALTWIVTQSNSWSSNRDTERTKLAATQVMQYGLSIQTAIRRLKAVNGCADSQISFERVPFDGSDTDYYYDNGLSGYKCHVFHESGGGVTAFDVPDRLNDGSEGFFTGATCVSGLKSGDYEFSVTDTCVSDDGMDVLYIIPNIDLDACLLINRKADIDAISGKPPQDYGDAWDPSSSARFFKNNFPTTGYNAISDNSGARSFHGKRYGCFEGGGSANFPADFYHFYYAVLDR